MRNTNFLKIIGMAAVVVMLNVGMIGTAGAGVRRLQIPPVRIHAAGVEHVEEGTAC